MRKLICIFLILLLCLCPMALAEDNLLINGDFSDYAGEFVTG